MLDRRSFLRLCAAAGVAGPSIFAADRKKDQVVLGCFNRPWARWGFVPSLKGVKDAGYNTVGLLTRDKAEPFIGVEATPEYLDKLSQQIADQGLKANMGSLRTRHDIAVEESVRELRAQIDNAARLRLSHILSFGVDKPSQYEHYYKVMRDGARYAADKNVKLVLKPHGGGSGASEEILRCVEKVDHPNFHIWYDAGNIIHYTGKDPVAELEPIVRLVTGFCAKDCAAQRGDVMIQFGAGKVDFDKVFERLAKENFSGPVMVEGCAGKTLEEVTANARSNRLFLEKSLRAARLI
jgi:sugar phosphate isomerase/epimerase